MNEMQAKRIEEKYGSMKAKANKKEMNIGRGRGRNQALGASGKPKDMKTTILRLAGYISGEARIVAAALFCSVTYTITSLLASYLLRPIINKFIYFEEGGADLSLRIKKTMRLFR